MLIYEDYFSYYTSPSSSSLYNCSKLDSKVYDIIFLPQSHTQQNIKQQYASNIQWFDKWLVS